MASKPSDFPTFTQIEKPAVEALLNKIAEYLSDFSEKIGISGISAHETVMLQVFDRIEKRRVYFHVFYDGCNMGELNEGSLMCFWIVKLQPFYDSHNKIPSNDLNSKIALYLFNKILSFYAANMNKKNGLTEKIMQDLYYSFRFRDISKESIMLLAESLIC
jgi:hypothetical protein